MKAFATGLDHPRWLHVLPNGDLLAAESNAPPRPRDASGVGAWVMKKVMKRAGAAVPSASRITLLRDANRDGVAETRTEFLAGLNSPFGMAPVGAKIVDLPAGTINHHRTKNIIASRDGSRLYVTVGSNSNVGENGMENELDPAANLEVDPATGESRVKPRRPDLVARAVVPDYALGAHIASPGLACNHDGLLPQHHAGGAFIGQHGSWNRKPRSGYEVIFVAFADGRSIGAPEDVLTGFVGAQGNALGRPVGVAVDRAGALLVADDVGNLVWRVTPRAD